MPSKARAAGASRTGHHLFVSHGTLWQAHHGDPAWNELGAWAAHNGPWRQIVAISAHWSSDPVLATADSGQIAVHEGFPPPLDAIRHLPPGAPQLAADLVSALNQAGLSAALTRRRGLDHGATIPLRILDPGATTPTLQLSLGGDLDPRFHVALGRALRLFADDALFVCSGGVVHNRRAIVPMSGREPPPPNWAVAFDEAVRSAMMLDGVARDDALVALTRSPGFRTAHPTPEHYVPLLVASGLGGVATEISRGFQWGSLSMASFAFGHPSIERGQTQPQGETS